MNKKIEKNFVLLVAIFLTIFTVLPVIAPIAAHFNLRFVSDPIYWIYQWFCHQRPWRSYHLFDNQLAMDSRMMLMFGAMAISSYIIHFKKIKPLSKPTAFLLAFVAILPLGLDGTIQMIAEFSKANMAALPFYESTNFIRSMTGLIFGVGVAFAVIPFLQFEVKGISKLKDYAKYIAVSSILSFLLIPILVFSWYITSSKYMPSSPFIDNIQRFPGYNYPIVGRSAHSTINPIIQEPLDVYIQRAQKYGKTDLLNDYKNRNR